MKHRVWSQNAEWRIRVRRRRLAHRGELLSPAEFCRRKGISLARLPELERRGQVFSVVIDRKQYLPAMFANCSFNRSRLEKLLRRLPPRMSPIAKYLFFVARRGSLGDKSPLQSTRRGKQYRVALRLADAEADEVRLRRAKAGEEFLLDLMVRRSFGACEQRTLAEEHRMSVRAPI
ncbi:hypothetical protein VSR82_37265 [Burkholderia sp. JPY481]